MTAVPKPERKRRPKRIIASVPARTRISFRSHLPRKKLVAKLDTVFSKFIRLRDKKCVQCGSTFNLTCGHLMSRIAYSTRWDEEQCFGQCRDCNLKHEYEPQHFTQWFINKFGYPKYQEISRRYSKTQKFPDFLLEQMIQEYQQKIQRMK